MKKEAFFKLSYGLYVVASKKDDQFNAQIANAVVQVASEPATLAVSINRENLTHEYISESKIFTISILSKETPLAFIGDLGFKSGRNVDKFEKLKFKVGKTGAPIVTDNSIAYFELELIGKLEAGTHTVFLGKVIDADILSDKEPMTYDYYHLVKGGVTPKTAPVYVEKDKAEKVISGPQKYRCKVCGYIYDPNLGDPDAGVKPGTLFEDIPQGWVCPLCGAAKDQFEKV